MPPPFVRVESAARFGTEIPLEYAYAAWGVLGPRGGEREGEKEGGGAAGRPAGAQMRGFLGVTREDVRALASARLRAMRHVEESFQYKNRRVEKEPLDLTRLDRVTVEPEEVPLRRSLEDFLLLEHHASFQERLLHLGLPPHERAQTGRAAVLRCERYEKNDRREERAYFRFAASGGDETSPSLSSSGLGVLRFRADDWVVLNPLADGEGRALPA